MPWIALDGAVNVRDVGGLPTASGAVTVGKRLLRADNLQQLSPSDLAVLVEECGVTRVVDLRSAAEVTSEGPGPLRAVDSVEHVHHSVIPVEGDHAASPELVSEVLLARQERFAAEDPDEVVSGIYHGYLQDRPDSVVAALRAIAGAPGSALVHCAAGKDRTGVVVALALLAVGVLPEAVAADYASTATRIEAILARLRSSPTYADGVDRVTVAEHTPRATAMRRFISILDSRHGGAITWLAAQGFGPDDVQLLRRKLLVP